MYPKFRWNADYPIDLGGLLGWCIYIHISLRQILPEVFKIWDISTRNKGEVFALKVFNTTSFGAMRIRIILVMSQVTSFHEIC